MSAEATEVGVVSCNKSYSCDVIYVIVDLLFQACSTSVPCAGWKHGSQWYLGHIQDGNAARHTTKTQTVTADRLGTVLQRVF